MEDRRFVILRHEDAQGVHFDLMIENGPRLAAWKFADPPDQAAGHAAGNAPAGRRIGDHRSIYLDYEGPVSGDRGRVCRHDAGTCGLVRQDDGDPTTAGRWEAVFHGGLLVGRCELVQSSPGSMEWFLSRLDS